MARGSSRTWTGEEIAALRAFVRETQADLAGGLTSVAAELGLASNDVHNTTVSRWERGFVQPNHNSCRLLTVYYGRLAESLGRDLDSVIKEAIVKRREFLAAMAGSATLVSGTELSGMRIALAGLVSPETDEYLERLVAALRKPSRIDTLMLNALQATTSNYWHVRLSGGVPSPYLLNCAKEHYGIVIQLLRGSPLPSARTLLSAIASETVLFMGMVSSTDLHRHDDARLHYETALTVAQQANNDALYAAVLGRMSALAALTGKPQEACALLGEAQRLVMQSDTFTLRSWLAAEEAERQADLTAQENTSNSTACFSALDRAARIVGQIRSDENAFGMYFDGARISAYRGSCNLRLHQPTEALEALGDALKPLQQLEPSGALTRAVLMDLAEASIQAGAIDMACAYLAQALGIVTQTQAMTSLERIRQLRRQLEPWSTRHGVHVLDQELRYVDTSLM